MNIRKSQNTFISHIWIAAKVSENGKKSYVFLGSSNQEYAQECSKQGAETLEGNNVHWIV